MRYNKRPPAPHFLKDNWKQWGAEYSEKKKVDPRDKFVWKQVNGEKVDKKLRILLTDMTLNHCSYCDGYPLGTTSLKTIDHFQPKETFAELVCQWENLFLACDVCQNSKRNQFNTLLLKPDEADFNFHRYFIYDHATGAIEPNPRANQNDLERATFTIGTFGFNNEDRPGDRKRSSQLRLKYNSKEALENNDEYPYRFIYEPA